ncbi:MAG: alginate export family protein [Pseudomonadota bacterium]
MMRPSLSLIRQFPAALAALSLLAFTTPARAADTVTEALTGGTTSANLRYRYETVNEDNNGKRQGTASTVRLRLGYKTSEYQGFGVMIEAEHLTALGNQSYNSTANGRTAYSTIADPTFTEINQAYLSYTGLPKTRIIYGRQRIALDNQRFIGEVDWRQNQQTFDAVTMVNESLPDTRITLGYINNVNRVFSRNALAASGPASGNFRMHSPIMNVNYKGWSVGELSAYGYLLDFGLPAANDINSTETFGVRMKGSAPSSSVAFLYTAEYATQAGYMSNPARYRDEYKLLEAGMDFKIAEVKLGYEALGSDGLHAFSTPLATLHAFNGWVDMFLTTPAAGLKDAYLSASTTVSGVKLGAVYHDFSAYTNGQAYGTELDLIVTRPIEKNYLVGVKYGRFNSESAPTRVNTDKFWLWAEMKF